MRTFHQLSLRMLRKNKMRTLVTLIGIVLSMTLFTAVLEGAWSGIVYLRNIEIYNNGKYHGICRSMRDKDLQKIKSLDAIKEIRQVREVGFARIPSKSDANPYLYIASLEWQMEGMVPLKVVSGRLPHNDQELVVTENLLTGGGVKYHLGEEIKPAVGKRAIGTQQQKSFAIYTDHEQLQDTREHSYKIVGIIKRTTYDLIPLSLPGYVAFTVGDRGNGTVSAAFTLKDPYRFDQLIRENRLLSKAIPHQALLALYGRNTGSVTAMIGLGFIIILLLMIILGTVSLIHNSFAISISERTRDYGMLRSIGATKKQLRSAVRFETFYLSTIGIPIGMIIGCAGIGLTFVGLRDAFTVFNGAIRITLCFNPVILLIAVAFCLITVMMSALRPLRRALRCTPVVAIRQEDPVKIGDRLLRDLKSLRSRNFYSLMARRQFYRHANRSRATTLAIFLSVVLFVSASSLISYYRKEMSASLDRESMADVTLTIFDAKKASDLKELYRKISDKAEDKEMECAPAENLSFFVRKKYMTKEYQDQLVNGDGSLDTTIRLLDDHSFKEICRQNKLEANKYMNKAEPLGIIQDHITLNDAKGRQRTISVLKESAFPISMQVQDTASKNNVPRTIQIGAQIKKPWFSEEGIIIWYPLSAMDNLYGTRDNPIRCSMNFRSADHSALADEIRSTLSLNGIQGQVEDRRNDRMTVHMFVFVLEVFAYGFIILISLVAMANVFNMISTSVILRKRELAMLRSVGMSRQGIHRMLSYECLYLGLTGLTLGIPVSLGITYIIYLLVKNNMGINFFIPWHALLIAIIAVFSITFVTTRFAEKKICRENLIEALRDENT